ncbi:MULTISPECIES: lipopolysaccharide assembly protein LapB [Gammaproteobacteria]|uniref:lipopolysaccharide assembly protein LapB n=1 Tax=Gammaproteobacteria TaxID=1236 RepID=UPI000DD08412|nr:MULTISPECIES: lipopolysaccharide assembly protein LapB [Gammaproteobacteria]RTE87291.1 lipopolysaccharide assembly protein LapB [Aliidiomarina sp. B3213]TCZ92923.1 lipopolysaccharide assembly protein LapB [Lysobacter sp. N42]
MLELLFLILPIAAAYGWFMGRNSVRQEQREEQKKFSKNYVTGINLLLSDQSDKAVDYFTEMLEVDSETIETHWTLGKLFRRRGEVDRAIKIHQNLIARPAITESQRYQAMFELGRDYLSAGFYDRAEKMLSELAQQKLFREPSERYLMQLYEATNEWNKAIRVALKIRRYDKGIEPNIAQFYCELAELQDKQDEVLKFYQKALSHDKDCVRARLALGRWYLGHNKAKECLSYFLPIIEDSPEFSSEVLPLLEMAYAELNDEDGLLSCLHDLVLENPSATAVIMLAKHIAAQNDAEAAEQFLLTALRRNPTMRGFHKLIEVHVQQAAPGKERDALSLLQSIVAEQIKQRPKYRCKHCGFSAQQLYWHCPSCKVWGEIKPLRGIDGE